MLFVSSGYDYSHALSDDVYTLVLSPHYYWCKKANREFKSSFQAKKFAPSFFDLDASYSYDVYAQEGTFYFVAFNKEAIKKQLQEQGLDLRKIDKIYLAQSFFTNFQRAIILNESEALARVSGVVVVVDQSLCSELYQSSELVHLACEDKVALNIAGLGKASRIEIQKPLILVAVTLFLWLVTSFINLSITQSELLAKHEALKVAYKLPQTSFQLKSMVKSLEKIDSQQQFIRESVDTLSLKRSIIAGSLREIELDTKSMKATFSKVLSQNTVSDLQKALKQHAKSVNVTTQNQATLLRVQR